MATGRATDNELEERTSFLVRLSKGDKKEIEQAAKREKRSTNNFIVWAAIRAARQK